MSKLCKDKIEKFVCSKLYLHDCRIINFGSQCVTSHVTSHQGSTADAYNLVHC